MKTFFNLLKKIKKEKKHLRQMGQRRGVKSSVLGQSGGYPKRKVA